MPKKVVPLLAGATVVALFCLLACSQVRAENPLVAVSTVPASVAPAVSTTTTNISPVVHYVSTASLTVADVGETISSPTPHGITEPSPDLSFFTLNRERLSNLSLPAASSVVPPQKGEAYDAQNAGELVARETGVLTLPQGAAAYPLNARIRGGSGDETLVLIDGRPVSGAALGAADLTEIPIEQIDHVEIVRGGLSALYGPNALGGVINVITKRATYTGYPVSHVSYENASYSHQTYGLDFGSRHGPFDYFFFGQQSWESGFRSNSDARRYNLGGNAGVSMGKAGKLLFDAGSFHRDASVPGARCDIFDLFCTAGTPPLEPSRFNNKDEKPASSPDARQTTDTNYLRASYLVGLPNDLFLAVRLFGQQREVELNDPLDPNPAAAASRDRREQSKGGELQLNLPLGFLVGGSFLHDHEDVQDRLTPANSFSTWVQEWGTFAQETFHWNSLTLIPSLRYDKNSQFGDTFNPRLQSLIDASDWLRFSASAGRSFRAPTIDETVSLPAQNYAGNPGLRPETAWTYDAGFELHESSRSFRLNYFRANIQNSIENFVPQDPANPLSPLTAVNLDYARRQGAEIEISRVASSTFRDALNYTFLDSVGTPAGFDHLVPLAFSPRHTVNYRATLVLRQKWTLNPVVRYEDSRFSGNDHTGTKMGSQLLFDLRLAYAWRQMDLYLGVNNIFAKRYVEVPGFPLPGRTAYCGIKLRLWG